MDRRQFLKVVGVTTASVPLLSHATKERTESTKEMAPKRCKPDSQPVHATFFVNGRWWRDMVIPYRMSRYRYLIPAVNRDSLYRIDEIPNKVPWGSIVCFECVELHYNQMYLTERRQYALFECKNPQFFVGSDGNVHAHGELA